MFNKKLKDELEAAKTNAQCWEDDYWFQKRALYRKHNAITELQIKIANLEKENKHLRECIVSFWRSLRTIGTDFISYNHIIYEALVKNGFVNRSGNILDADGNIIETNFQTLELEPSSNDDDNSKDVELDIEF